MIGAALVIVAMTAILVSTSTQLIRGRLRLERLQRQMLISRELDQAREIQLAWLPERQGARSRSTSPPSIARPAMSAATFTTGSTCPTDARASSSATSPVTVCPRRF